MDQHGNHVVQKAVELVPLERVPFVVDALAGKVLELSTHPYGCRVVQRLIEHCHSHPAAAVVVRELYAHARTLIEHQYGNYVMQYLITHGSTDDSSRVVAIIKGSVLAASRHKFSSNVVEKCIVFATAEDRAALIQEVLTPIGAGAGVEGAAAASGVGTDGPPPLHPMATPSTASPSVMPLDLMVQDQYANYVVQKMLDYAEPAQRAQLSAKIASCKHLSEASGVMYGRHILAKLGNKEATGRLDSGGGGNGGSQREGGDCQQKKSDNGRRRNPNRRRSKGGRSAKGANTGDQRRAPAGGQLGGGGSLLEGQSVGLPLPPPRVGLAVAAGQ
jgi:pumilio RNA-binding family